MAAPRKWSLLMTDRRPPEQTSHPETTSQKNDRLILAALEDLEDPVKRGKRKPTVPAICKMTGLSKNTIRNREWAVTKLQGIKRKLKKGTERQPDDKSGPEPEDTPAVLRGRITRILQQNVLLYEKVLQQQEMIGRQKAEIAAHKARSKLSIVLPVGATNE